MRLHTQIFFTAAFAGALALGWLWLEGQGDAAESASAPARLGANTLVLVEPLYLAEDRIEIQAIGTSEALRSAALYPSVAGEVEAVLFTPGQEVTQGDTLLHLEDKHERLALRLAEVAVKEAKRQVDRLAKLAPSGAVPVARLETAEAELESARLRVDQARADLADRTLRAPFDGIIGMTETDKGDRVTEDSLIAILDDRSAIEIEFDLPEEYAARIEPGMAVELRPWSNREVSIEGRISATDSRIAAATRSLKVKARIENPVNRIRPGMSYEVRLAFGQRHYPAVREVAVLWSREGAYLWRVAGERAEKVFVEILRRSEGNILVEGDLEIGDLIVVEGLQGLRNGQQVEVEPFDREPADRTSNEAAPSGQTAEAD